MATTRSDQSIPLVVQLLPAHGDDDRLEGSTLNFLQELRDLSVDATPVRKSSVPEGSKSMDAAVLGTLAIKLLPSVLPLFLAFLKDWLHRNDGHSAKIVIQDGGGRSRELEIHQNLSPSEIQQLIDAVSPRS